MLFMLRSFILGLLMHVFCMYGFSESYFHHNEVYKLVNAYHDLIEKDNSYTQKVFFDAFPNKWDDFIRVEGYMYDIEGELFTDYVEAFGRLTTIDDTTYCAKLVNLCIGADFAADGPAFLQAVLHEKIRDATNGDCSLGRLAPIILSLLSYKTQGELISFWLFYWDRFYHEEGDDEAYNISKTDFHRLRKIVKRKFPKMLYPMTITFDAGSAFITDVY